MMVKLLEAGEREKFNRDMEWTLKISPSTRSMLALRMRPYRVPTPYEFFSASRDYVLTDELIAQITTPVLITSPDNEQFWPGQSEELFDKDRKSTRLNSSHLGISYAVFCLKK